jgi:hypothetical protein
MNRKISSEKPNDRSRLLLHAALYYASLGIPVVPMFAITFKNTGTGDNCRRIAVCTCGKINCGSPGKHPMTRHGYKDGTTDQDKLKRFFGAHPEANIGIVFPASNVRTQSSSNLMDTLGYNDPTRGVYHDRAKRS